MSVNAGVAVKRSYDVIQDAYFNTFEASGTRKSWFEYDSYDSNLDVAALLNIEQTLRRNDRIGLCVFLAGNAMESFQNRTGVDYEERELFGESRLKHVYRLANSQLTGVHELGRWTLDWGKLTEEIDIQYGRIALVFRSTCCFILASAVHNVLNSIIVGSVVECSVQ